MKAALHNSYIDYVFYMGLTEKYPEWFNRELENDIYTDEHRYTFYIPKNERMCDYYDRILVEDYSVFLRKSDGSIFVTDYDTFCDLYDVFKYNSFTNSGLAAFKGDSIEYVECIGGVVVDDYPNWFYEHFTESTCSPDYEESIFINVNGEVSVKEHSVFMRNKLGEIRSMSYSSFRKYYDPSPEGWLIQ